MIAALLTLGLGLHVPTPVETPDALAEHALVCVLQATETHFVATNPGLEPSQLWFGDDDGVLLGRVTLAPGQRVAYPFARAGAADVWVDVRRPGERPVHATGPLSVQDLVLSEAGALWVTPGDDELRAWTLEGGELRRVHPARALLLDVAADLVAHVPGGPTPTPRPDRPPVVPDDALPPV